jgi:anti-sigma factor RsiW
MYTCDDLRAELSNLLDEETAPGVRAEIERHLSECRACTVLVDSTRKTLRIVTDAGTFELPVELSDRLTALIMTKIRSDRTD